MVDPSSVPVLLCELSSKGFGSATPPFTTLTPFDIDEANLTDPFLCWSNDRQLLAVVANGDEKVFVIPVVTIHTQKPVPSVVLSEKGVTSICFSSNSTFICTWRKPVCETDLNMAIWSTATGSCILRSRRARLNKFAGDPVQWSTDEKTVWILNGSELLGYELLPAPSTPHNPNRHPYKFRLHVPDMIRFWLAPLVEPCYRMLILVAEKKGEPARCCIYNSNAFDTIVCSKSFFQSDDVDGFWSPSGHAVLVKASAAHDASGKSYYGSASLYLLPADGYNPSTTIVSAGSDGACAHVQWNPIRSKREFGVICGRRAWICNASNGKCVVDFGRNAWNTFQWSPSGRYVVLGGFGNLPGKLWFFDRTEKLFLGSGVDHSSKFISWAPDSKSLITARLFPARRVDNGFTVFSYSGEMMAKHDFDRLLDVQILSLQSEYPNEPTSVEILDKSQPIEAAASSTLGGAVAGVYVPPKAREAAAAAASSGRPLKNAVSSMLQQLRNESGSQSYGTQPASPEIQINKAIDPHKTERSQAKKERKAKTKAAAAAAAVPVDSTKATKALMKKLRQILQIKEQVAKDPSVVLSPEQVEKISKEFYLLKQLESLQIQKQ